MEYVGFLDTKAKRKALIEHDCLLVPSHWESFGLSVIEAAACGLQAVVSEHPNLRQLLPEALILWAPHTEPHKMAKAIEESLTFAHFSDLRTYYTQNYRIQIFTKAISDALSVR